ncbi:uncharacterized protein J8A68_005022 [[Candida] subhashii]|uniref:Integrase catalytic domain-containing protein n=1 Tax=[Candida] subhashii TaxID=561895 RepID=A0A8J5UW66_9ASCO|nr:uncharacterized protein J8A68_005022 [[Candida] subhashii]KAG7661444.1 hypothetical protein J8A68_005022 [[Candida] subhashii]
MIPLIILNMDELPGSAIADLLYEEFICRFGYFIELKTDRGAEFKNEMVDRLLYHYGTKHSFSIQHHPQGNGMIERNHQGLINFMKKLPDGLNWREYLATALWVDRMA